MHGVFNRAMEAFFIRSEGEAAWAAICRGADIRVTRFEPLLVYDDAITHRLLEAACIALGRPREALLEAVGESLIETPSTFSLRRLLRFGGTSFVEFVQTLEEVRARACLALPDLELPHMRAERTGLQGFRLYLTWNRPGFGPLFLGILRAMARDYGTAVHLRHDARIVGGQEQCVITILLLEGTQRETADFALVETGS
ncbi:MAG: heme NO-binding domain-containing protein [Rhodobacteraceae bacterium]|nr:heme NO-binding domain-containing protein [Paracoccaceae bacterium]